MESENCEEHERQAELDAARSDDAEANTTECDSCLAREDCLKVHRLRGRLRNTCEDYLGEEDLPRIKNFKVKEGI